ncbi:MAG: sodium:solute symporter family transporter, partial [Desulfohalobiaceae bacterium]
IENTFQVNYTVAVSVFGIVIAAYVIAGGLKGVMYADALQGSLMFIGMLVLIVFTYANLGCEARLGWNLPWDFGTALIRPGATLSAPIPGHDQRSDFGLHVFAGTDVRLVLQNIFLDGNTWKSSHSVDKKPFVADLYAGIGLSYKRFRIVYTHAYRTEEFDGQGSGQSFGSVNLRYAF